MRLLPPLMDRQTQTASLVGNTHGNTTEHTVRRKNGVTSRLAVVAACLVLLCPWAKATEGPGLKLSGFGTLGVVSQSVPEGWGFMRESSQPAPRNTLSLTPDTRTGVQLDWRPHTELEATLQAVLRKRPSGTPLSESVTWAYVGWRPTPNTRLRLGRTSPDIFLYANSRHVGYALPWVRPPSDLYGFLNVHAVDGVEASHQWLTDDAAWLVRGAAGRLQTTTSGANRPGVDPFLIRGRDALVLTGQRESGALLLKASYKQVQLNLSIEESLRPLVQALDGLTALPIPGWAEQVAPLRASIWSGGQARYSALGLQYDSHPWLVHAEVSQLNASGTSMLPARRGYVSLGYRWNDWTFYGLVGRILSEKPALAAPDAQAMLGPIIGAAGAAQAQVALEAAAMAGNSYRYDQSSMALGLRWELASQVALKFQVDRTKVHPYGAGQWQSDGTAVGASNLVTSLVLDFVWGQ